MIELGTSASCVVAISTEEHRKSVLVWDSQKVIHYA